jgi:hypothetical protein
VGLTGDYRNRVAIPYSSFFLAFVLNGWVRVDDYVDWAPFWRRWSGRPNKEAAIDSRIAEIQFMSDGTPDERRAITDARSWFANSHRGNQSH